LDGIWRVSPEKMEMSPSKIGISSMENGGLTIENGDGWRWDIVGI